MSGLLKIETAKVDDLYLDPQNPRLGRHVIDSHPKQESILEVIRDWSLEELAVSFLESGFWPQEALIAVKDEVYGEKGTKLVIVEGNRRLAALKMIERVQKGLETSKKWVELIKSYDLKKFKVLENVPYILQPSRQALYSYIGFRHVTGIKEWNPAEKAQFIAHLVEKEKLDYETVRRRIGSKLSTVRQNYISYRLLLQMENQEEDIDLTQAEERFSVLYLSLRTVGVRTYLQIDIEADPKSAKQPVPKEKLDHLVNFARWLFGTGKSPAVLEDSRQIDEFGKILESPQAVQYLERTERPVFSVARRLAGVAEINVAEHIERAADETEEALKAVHQHKNSVRIQTAVKRLGQDTNQLLEIFPEVKKSILEQK